MRHLLSVIRKIGEELVSNAEEVRRARGGVARVISEIARGRGSRGGRGGNG